MRRRARGLLRVVQAADVVLGTEGSSRNACSGLTAGPGSRTLTWPSAVEHDGDLVVDARTGLASGWASWTSTSPSTVALDGNFIVDAQPGLASGSGSRMSTWPSTVELDGDLGVDARAGLASGSAPWTSTWPSAVMLDGDRVVDARSALDESALDGDLRPAGTAGVAVDRHRSGPGTPVTAGRHERALRALRMVRARRLALASTAAASRTP
jgi:hypothetical protein